MKVLHSADWHLDSPALSDPSLRRALLSLPRQVTELALKERCDLMLLSGDLFDGQWSPESLSAAQRALREAGMPVFIAPGNHDPMGPGSPWQQPGWPENVHIFRDSAPQSLCLPGLDCRVWGAAFQNAHSACLLEGFRAEGTERYALGVFHGDPTQPDSPYSPISRGQVLESGLDYLALGHIHKTGSFRAGDTLCAWPGCPMGRGFDECGEKGVLIVSLEEGCQARFVPLALPRFHWLTVEVKGDPYAAVSALLPGAGSQDHYRIELTGECEAFDTEALAGAFPDFPNLELRDCTAAPPALWASAGQDTLEGVYFSLLQEAQAPEHIRQLAARISHRLLLGQEVELP